MLGDEGTTTAALLVAGVQDTEEARRTRVPLTFDGKPWKIFGHSHTVEWWCSNKSHLDLKE